MSTFYSQSDFEVRCEWGAEGIEALSVDADIFIIVDVLSFSTCVDIATSRGGVIIPYKYKDDSVEAYAVSIGAIAAHRTRVADRFSLSPRSLLNLPSNSRLVLPSPNGSTLSLMCSSKPTLAGCLRNSSAIAAYASQYRTIAVIACGERWQSQGTLRPAFEDLIGAGAIISKLNGRKSPEALAAEAAFFGIQRNVEESLMTCASGIELIKRNDTEDVRLAAQLDSSTSVPLIKDGEYRNVSM